PYLADHVLLERDDGRILRLEWRRILLLDPPLDTAYFGLRLCERGSGLQASQDAPVMSGAACISGIAGRGERQPDLCLLGPGKARWHHSDDGGRHTGHAQPAAENRGIAAERA